MRDNGLEDASFVRCVGDGAKWVRGLKDGVAPNATFVLDLFHLKENAMEFAQHLYGDTSEYYPRWRAVCAELEDGQWRKVLVRPEVARYRDQDTPDGVCSLYRTYGATATPSTTPRTA